MMHAVIIPILEYKVDRIIYYILIGCQIVPNSIIIITKLHFVLPVAAELVKQGHIQLT